MSVARRIALGEALEDVGQEVGTDALTRVGDVPFEIRGGDSEVPVAPLMPGGDSRRPPATRAN